MYQNQLSGIPRTSKRGASKVRSYALTLLAIWVGSLRTSLNTLISVSLGLLATLPAFGTGLNDTGITFCTDLASHSASCLSVSSEAGTFPRQDARFGRDAQAVKNATGNNGFDFTKIANDGSPTSIGTDLGPALQQWGCTRDNVTGLVWEVKTTSGLRSYTHRYTWYQTDVIGGISNGGVCETAGKCDTEKYVTEVNQNGLCGKRDWRLPTAKELQNIVHFGVINPSIDISFFPNTPNTYWWTMNPAASANGFAWGVDFAVGGTAKVPTSTDNPIRLVRGGL